MGEHDQAVLPTRADVMTALACTLSTSSSGATLKSARKRPTLPGHVICMWTQDTTVMIHVFCPP